MSSEGSPCYRLATDAILAGYFEGHVPTEQYGPFSRGSSRVSRSSAAHSDRSATLVRQPSVAAAYLQRTATLTQHSSKPRPSVKRAQTFGDRLASSLLSMRASVLRPVGCALKRAEFLWNVRAHTEGIQAMFYGFTASVLTSTQEDICEGYAGTISRFLRAYNSPVPAVTSRKTSILPRSSTCCPRVLCLQSWSAALRVT